MGQSMCPTRTLYLVGFEPPPEHLIVIQLNGIDHLVLVTERIAVLYGVIVVKTHQISGTQTVGIAIPKKNASATQGDFSAGN